MQKHEELSKGEELLAQVLEECLEEDLSFVPPEREISRKHRFSEEFEQAMQSIQDEILEELRKKKRGDIFPPGMDSGRHASWYSACADGCCTAVWAA